MTPALARSITTSPDADRAYGNTLAALLDHGVDVVAGDTKSIGSGQRTKELLNFSIAIENPRERLLRNSARQLNLPAAVARFVWMMAGSDRLADIAFYEPKVRAFSDDGISVPGSSYGQRILQPRPGLNQLVAAVARLKEDAGSRRAAISIYHPEDAVRDSKDIPCAFGIFYHIRGGELFSTTMMRSNNAYILMPYNIFEFSLLAEMVAAELSVGIGALTHFAASMHLYERDFAGARKVVDGLAAVESTRLPSLPSIPTSAPIEQVRELVRLEAELRHASAAVGGDNIEQWIQEGENRLNAYWRSMYYLLLLHVAQQNKSKPALEALDAVIPSPWRDYLPPGAFAASDYTLIGDLSFLELPPAEQAKIIPLHLTRTHRALQARVEHWEASHEPIDWRTFVALESRFAGEMAARGDRSEIPEAEFEAALRSLKGRTGAPNG